jgi:HEAT repeat protein
MTEEPSNFRAPELGSSGVAAPDAKIAEVATWLGQFSRTLKTCRLYDSRNPNTIKFREDLGVRLVALLETHGAISLEFTAREVACDGHTVMVSRTREDNFAMPFYRDGLRTLTFTPGTEPRELDAVIDLVLRVTSRANNGTEDLVTLLWDADMPHLDMSYVSSETDADLGEDGEVTLGASVPHRGALMPWPGEHSGEFGDAAEDKEQVGAQGPASGGEPGTAASAGSGLQHRSEDWLAGDPTGQLKESFETVAAASAGRLEQFVTTMREERRAPLVHSTLALVRDAMRADLLEGDREDLTDLLERVLLEAIAAADWQAAHQTVDGLTECSEGQWDAFRLGEVLASPDSVVTAELVRQLDGHPLAKLQEFVGFARGLGPAAIEWLMGIVALANHQRTRRTLVRTLSEMCEGHPERLAPWLSDPRWYVVRNAVLVAGSNPEGAPAGMFVPVLHHEDPRVRQEVVTALARVDVDSARPLLLELLRDPEAPIRSAALHQLGSKRNAQAGAAILELVLDTGFRKRPPEEVRSVTAALGGCAGDEVLPRLEEQLYPPKWFSHGEGPFCQAIARCIGRIGTPAAIVMLERGAGSRVAVVRDACRLVLSGMNHG